MATLLSTIRLPQTVTLGTFGRKDLKAKRSYAGSIKALVVIAANGKALLSGFEFEKQKYMNKEQIRIEAETYNKSLKRHPSSEQALTEILVQFAERLQNLQQCNFSGSVPYYKYWALNCISDIIQKYGSDKYILAGFVNACLCRKEQEWLDKHIGTDR